MRTPYWSLLLLLPSCAGARDERRASAPMVAEAVPVGAGASALDAASPLTLQPGQVVELALTPDGAAGARLATSGGDERFVLIVASSRFEGKAPAARYSVAFEPAPAALRARPASGCSLQPGAFPGGALPAEPEPSGPAPAVGARRELSISPADAAEMIGAEVVAVGARAAVWRDVTHPTSLDAAFAEGFLRDFEQVILPRARQVFGMESDLDGDGRIGLVFSRLTRQRGVAFFSACDLRALEGCPASNHGEYLYLTPPDAIDPPYNTSNAIKEILSHELAHLLHFNQKVSKNGLSAWTDTVYASEGIGGLAQDVVGYQAGNLYVAKAGLDGIEHFSLADVLDRRRRRGVKDGISRGGAYLFFRYLYDRAGGDEAVGVDVQSRGGPAFLRALLAAREPIAEALPRVTGASLADLGMDFYTALALSNREEAGLARAENPCFRYLPTATDPITGKQRGTNLFASFHGMRMSGPHIAAAADGELLAGGVAYLGLDARPGQPELGFTLRVAGESAPRVRLARWR